MYRNCLQPSRSSGSAVWPPRPPPGALSLPNLDPASANNSDLQPRHWLHRPQHPHGTDLRPPSSSTAATLRPRVQHLRPPAPCYPFKATRTPTSTTSSSWPPLISGPPQPSPPQPCSVRGPLMRSSSSQPLLYILGTHAPPPLFPIRRSNPRGLRSGALPLGILRHFRPWIRRLDASYFRGSLRSEALALSVFDPVLCRSRLLIRLSWLDSA